MMVLPLLFVGVVARFPAGLAVYWITTSLWTLGQQLCFWRLAAADGPLSVTLPAPAAAPSARPARTARRKRKHGRRR
jgi:YidC/Oxa1 family membrane protein insertase